MSVILEAGNLHWLEDLDPEADLCAHGSVHVEFGGVCLARHTEQDWCLSAAALFLLRTLTHDHVGAVRVGENLVPHCGNAVWQNTNGSDVIIIECNTGIDWSVIHEGSSVILKTTNGAATDQLTLAEWKALVCNFADTASEFYAGSVKLVSQDGLEDRGYAQFWEEWNRRRSA